MSKSLETKGTRCETHDSQQLGVFHALKRKDVEEYVLPG